MHKYPIGRRVVLTNCYIPTFATVERHEECYPKQKWYWLKREEPLRETYPGQYNEFPHNATHAMAMESEIAPADPTIIEEVMINVGPMSAEGAEMLKQQRRILTKLIDGEALTDEERELSYGLQNFLDHVADQLHDVHGFDTLWSSVELGEVG